VIAKSAKRSRRGVQIGLLALLSLPFLPAACGADGVVGGDCRDGFKNCSGVCVRTRDDRSNCGACGLRCEPGVSCVAGRCVLEDGSAGTGGADAGPDGDASDDHSQGGDGSNPDGSNPDGSNPDGALTDSDIPDAECAPPFNTPARCGDCDTQCTGNTPYCQRAGEGTYDCVPACDEGLVLCHGECVDLSIDDPFNCGACGIICPTRLCVNHKCVGASPGHMVSMCSNFAGVTRDVTQARLLDNALFGLSLRNPLRVLTYAVYATPSVTNHVNNLIGALATARGRSVQFTPVSLSGDVVDTLNVLNYDAFLVYDQATAPAGALTTFGTAINATLDLFARGGGIVVALDGGVGTAHMGEFLTSAGLLNVSGEIVANGAQATTDAPGDAVGINVDSPFVTQKDSCTFTTADAPDSTRVFVTSAPRDDAGARAPVVVHRVRTQ
jgi:hypothetical protein